MHIHLQGQAPGTCMKSLIAKKRIDKLEEWRGCLISQKSDRIDNGKSFCTIDVRRILHEFIFCLSN